MVFVSHDLAGRRVANSITVMCAGQIVEQGSVQHLTNPSRYTRGLLGSVPSIERAADVCIRFGIGSQRRLPEGRPYPRSGHPDAVSDVRGSQKGGD
ncbi:MAG: hypothetical protein ACLRX5_04730 [Slackia sp.]